MTKKIINLALLSVLATSSLNSKDLVMNGPKSGVAYMVNNMIKDVNKSPEFKKQGGFIKAQQMKLVVNSTIDGISQAVKNGECKKDKTKNNILNMYGDEPKLIDYSMALIPDLCENDVYDNEKVQILKTDAASLISDAFIAK